MRARDVDKEQLVKQKAIEGIVKHGLEGFSMNKLAKECKISVATLYIYYKDRDDLIIKLMEEEGRKMAVCILEGFDPEASFEDGLRVQWKNRFKYMVDNPLITVFFEQIRSSSYHKSFLNAFKQNFEGPINKFTQNVLARGEIKDIPLEIYWSVAFGPLYALIRFHSEGVSISGAPFTMSDEVLWSAFDLVIKALKN